MRGPRDPRESERRRPRDERVDSDVERRRREGWGRAGPRMLRARPAIGPAAGGATIPGPQEVADFIRTPAGAMVGWPGGECAGLEKIIRPPGSRRIRPTPYSDRRPHGQHLFMNSIAILNSPARKSAPKSNFRAKHRQSSICPALTLPRKTSVRMPVSRTDSGVPSWTTRPLSNT